MTDERPVRACAIQNHASEKPQLWTLWETDPQFQTALLQCVESYQTLDRYNFDLPYFNTLVWQDFPNIAAVEATNTALHNECWLDEVEFDLGHPNENPPIATMHRRLQEQRDTHGGWSVTCVLKPMPALMCPAWSIRNAGNERQ
jgi:hypothetical protein